MSRVLLTGATGFVGSQVLPVLAGEGHEVHAVARRRGPEQPGCTWHEADLLQGCELVREIQPEVLLHLAWYAEHGRFWSSPENVPWVERSLALLRAFAQAGGRRALLAGTCAEYDWSREVYPESAALAPATLYGAAKAGLHTVAAAYAAEMGISMAWARLFFLYGPGEAPGRFVPAIIRSLLRGEPAAITAGTQRRDFLHVADLGAALAAVAQSSVSGPVNVASGTGVSLLDIAEMIARRLDAEELLEVGALPMREQDPQSLVADVSRLREEVGWHPAVELGAGLDQSIEWWRARELGGAEGSRSAPATPRRAR